MTTAFDVLRWAPRVLGLLVTLFIGMFALDAFSEGKPILHALADFGIHLIPALILLAVVLASFKWEWIGGLAFIALALIYALTMARGRLDWMLTISGPLLLVGGLFLWSWLRHGKTHTA